MLSELKVIAITKKAEDLKAIMLLATCEIAKGNINFVNIGLEAAS